MKDKMLAFMSERKFCVVSTIHANGTPESAFVAYTSSNLDLFIGTSNLSRKFANITANPAVAIVIADQQGEIQYEGQATVVDPENFTEVEESHLSQIPGSDKYRKDPTQEYIHITPTWIRFIDHTVEDQVEEWSEF